MLHILNNRVLTLALSCLAMTSLVWTTEAVAAESPTLSIVHFEKSVHQGKGIGKDSVDKGESQGGGESAFDTRKSAESDRNGFCTFFSGWEDVPFFVCPR